VRRGLLFGTAVLLLAGCGSREGTIPESAVVDAMHRAGVVDVNRLTGPKAPSPSAFELAGRDLFYAGPFRPEGKFQLAVLWSDSSPPALEADRRARSAVVHRAQVCNVDVTAYGDRRFDRVVGLLRKACR
jgi:hypothetical protein